MGLWGSIKKKAKSAAKKLNNAAKATKQSALSSVANVKKLTKDPKGYFKDVGSSITKDVTHAGTVWKRWKDGDWASLGKQGLGDMAKAAGKSDKTAQKWSEIGEKAGEAYATYKDAKKAYDAGDKEALAKLAAQKTGYEKEFEQLKAAKELYDKGDTEGLAKFAATEAGYGEYIDKFDKLKAGYEMYQSGDLDKTLEFAKAEALRKVNSKVGALTKGNLDATLLQELERISLGGSSDKVLAALASGRSTGSIPLGGVQQQQSSGGIGGIIKGILSIFGF